MTPLRPGDLVALEVFEALRPRWREAVIAHKRARRVALGDRVSLVFEDRETIRWQVLEMCRVERIRDPAAVQHELDVYNELLPSEHELSATLYIEITEAGRIRPELDRLVGLDEHVLLRVGSQAVRARFDQKQFEDDRISAVHYLKFPLGPALAAAFLDPTQPASLGVDHPAYQAESVLAEATRASLAVDLRGDPAPLLDPAGIPVATPGSDAAEPEVLVARGRVRAVRPAEPCGPGHVVVEPIGNAADLEHVEPALLAELLELARELAGPLRRRFGACRVALDAASSPVRVDVYAPPAD